MDGASSTALTRITFKRNRICNLHARKVGLTPITEDMLYPSSQHIGPLNPTSLRKPVSGYTIVVIVRQQDMGTMEKKQGKEGF